jgi:hypothetical protein
MVVEDISTTGSTVWHLGKILRGLNPDAQIHSVSWLRRSPIRYEYAQGPDAVNFHTLSRVDIPTEYKEFVEKFGFEPELV